MSLRVPFGAVFQPRVGDAARALDAAVARRRELASDEALRGLSAGLATSLAVLTSPMLFERFLSHPGRHWLDPTAHRAYDRFVDELCQGRFEELLDATPSLSHLVASQCREWLRETSLFLERLEADASLLGEIYRFALPAVGARQAVKTAIELTDRRGTKVMYKCRSLAMDAAFGEVIAWFNEQAPELPLSSPVTVDRGPYGWAQHIDHANPDTPGERADYLRRCGMLLCLAHLLGGGDVHEGNLRIAGACPMLIDGEKLLRPGAQPLADDGPDVTTTHLLPTVPGYERCGLAAELYLERPCRWLHLQSDALRPRSVGGWLYSIRPAVEAHLGAGGGEMADLLTAGFRSAYDLIDRALPLDAFIGCRARVLLRSTLHYDDLLERCLRPEVLAAPQARRASIDAFVARPPLLAEQHPALRSRLAEAERHALDRHRPPRFWCPVAQTILVSELGAVGTAYVSAPVDRAHRFIAGMCAARRDEQIAAIKSSFARLRGGAPRTHDCASITPLPLAMVVP